MKYTTDKEFLEKLRKQKEDLPMAKRAKKRAKSKSLNYEKKTPRKKAAKKATTKKKTAKKSSLTPAEYRKANGKFIFLGADLMVRIEKMAKSEKTTLGALVRKWSEAKTK